MDLFLEEDGVLEMTLDGVKGYFVPLSVAVELNNTAEAKNDLNNLQNAVEGARDLLYDAIRELDNA